MTVFPKIESRLAEAAEELAADEFNATSEQHARASGGAAAQPLPRRERWRRRPWLSGPLAVVALAAAAGGVAYATDLWRPPLGEFGRGEVEQVAVGGGASGGFAEILAALRREQTDADRGPASAYALKFPHKQRGVLTGGVRLLGETSAGSAIVLVPTTNAVGTTTPPGDSAAGVTDAPATSPRDEDEVCVWIRDVEGESGGGESGGRACADLDELRRGKLFLSIGDPQPEPTAAEQAAMRRAMQRARDRDECFVSTRPLRGEELKRIQKTSDQVKRQPDGSCVGYAIYGQVHPSEIHWTALIPDGVATVVIGEGEHELRAPVRGNVAMADADESSFFKAFNNEDDVRWLDADGREVGPQR